ncbi:hypothetical protein [Sphingobacterium sp.]|uniref:hypothetical protein n=1 Tax=Sphingobacterium sp. TaxID=341027 RepID=UPI0028A258AC|nr:hypothetical protein [Sphingobacterium sp.]
MKSEVKIENQSNMVITLIICGGPIGKRNGKTTIQSEVSEEVEKKAIKADTDKGKKTSYVDKTK